MPQVAGSGCQASAAVPRTALLISTYEMGRQPFGLASPAAWLRHAGIEVRCLDLSREPFEADLPAQADLIAFHLPMHTATRLAVPIIKRVRAINPAAKLCAYGLYAPLNADLLRSLGVESILGGEFEAALVEVAMDNSSSGGSKAVSLPDRLPRLEFLVPDRHDLPAPSRYATLQVGPSRRLVGYTEASRGCKHHCRHCPVVPIYKGQFRVVPLDVVLADIRQQVDLGVQHVTFGDPDFFNGVGHARRVVMAVAREFPNLSYDVTIKVEHLLRHADDFVRLRETGCLFVTSAVESFDDQVLAYLAKGHTREDINQVVTLSRCVGLTLIPTFVAFTPWTTLDGYCKFLHDIAWLDLVDSVAPIQLALRLLVPEGSRLLERPEFEGWLRPFDAERLVHPWIHSDPRVDALADQVGQVVSRNLTSPRRTLFKNIWALAHNHAGLAQAPLPDFPQSRTEVPYLNEPWYC